MQTSFCDIEEFCGIDFFLIFHSPTSPLGWNCIACDPLSLGLNLEWNGKEGLIRVKRFLGRLCLFLCWPYECLSTVSLH